MSWQPSPPAWAWHGGQRRERRRPSKDLQLVATSSGGGGTGLRHDLVVNKCVLTVGFCEGNNVAGKGLILLPCSGAYHPLLEYVTESSGDAPRSKTLGVPSNSALRSVLVPKLTLRAGLESGAAGVPQGVDNGHWGMGCIEFDVTIGALAARVITSVTGSL